MRNNTIGIFDLLEYIEDRISGNFILSAIVNKVRITLEIVWYADGFDSPERVKFQRMYSKDEITQLKFYGMLTKDFIDSANRNYCENVKRRIKNNDSK